MKVLKGVFLAIVIFFGFILICGILAEDESTEGTQESSKRSYQSTSYQAPQNQNYDLQFYLKSGEKGDFGRLLVYNAGTEFEEVIYGYYVPSGKYYVTNLSTYTTQVNVYSDETHIVNGWVEPKETKCYLLKSTESKEIIVPEGFHIEIADQTYIQMKRIAGTGSN